MAWSLTVTCDGCGTELADVSPRWRRSGYTGQPSHGFHPYDGTLPDGWVWHEIDGDDDVTCPDCRDESAGEGIRYDW